jgi:hypothetical protein
VFRAHAEAVAHLLSTYFDSGTVDISHFRDVPMDFHVKPSFPLLAKLGAATVLTLIAVVVAIVLSLLR